MNDSIKPITLHQWFVELVVYQNELINQRDAQTAKEAGHVFEPFRPVRTVYGVMAHRLQQRWTQTANGCVTVRGTNLTDALKEQLRHLSDAWCSVWGTEPDGTFYAAVWPIPEND